MSLEQMINTARDRVIQRSMAYVSSQFYLEQNEPGPNDDAEMEYKQDALESAVLEYAAVLIQRKAVERSRLSAGIVVMPSGVVNDFRVDL